MTSRPILADTAEQLARSSPRQPRRYRIQLGSFSTEQASVAAWDMFRRKYSGILGERELIREVVSREGRQFYRVQTAVQSESEARLLCDQLKDRGQACLVVAPKSP